MFDEKRIQCHPDQWVPDGMHKHQCQHCGNCWAHSDNCIDNVRAHTCTNCGERQWEKYWTEQEWRQLMAQTPKEELFAAIAEMFNIR